MISTSKPYLILPKLIEQPTWGGEYICTKKNWDKVPFLTGKKFGQSYELFSGSKLSLSTSTQSTGFIPELGFAEKPDTIADNFHLKAGEDFITLSDLIAQNAEETLGAFVYKKYQKMPLLIKFTQALGNSFQLHIKPGTKDSHWQPKPESWFYFEPGRLTFGLKEGVDINLYKSACIRIDNFMKSLSTRIKEGSIDIHNAREQARIFIKKENPWQYVNVVEVDKDTIIDLSAGGLHHSWEEPLKKNSLGNVLYEVQYDVMDPVSTIRSFDQGKMKDNGDIRPVQIEDYFKYIDTDPQNNSLASALSRPQGSVMLHTELYSVDMLECTGSTTQEIGRSFVHLFVYEGTVTIETKDGSVSASCGHSIFVPNSVKSYKIITSSSTAKLLKTFI